VDDRPDRKDDTVTPMPSDDPPSPGRNGAPMRGEASRRPALDRDKVLSAALDLVDAHGLDALTMRALGRKLGRDPMALYRYVPNRSALLDGLVELVLSQLVIPAASGDWQGQLRRTAHDFRRLTLAHPHVIPLLITRPLSTPLGLRPIGTLRPLEQFLELLIGAGFSPVDTLHIYRIFFGFLYGHINAERLELVPDPQEAEHLLHLGLHRLPRDDFPNLRSLGAALARYDGAEELDHALDIILTGLIARLDVQRGSQDHASGPTRYTQPL
jgi:AcrR family transcriptional regulator